MEKAYQLLQFMNGVFDDLLDDNGQLEGVELGHVVGEAGDHAQCLAHQSFRAFLHRLYSDLVVWLRQVSYVQFLDESADFIEGLEAQDDEEEAAHVPPGKGENEVTVPGLRVLELEHEGQQGQR